MKEALTALGLTDKESAIYIAILPKQGLTIQEISKKTGINRTFCYELIRSLVKKGMLTTTEQARGSKYFAIEPRTIKLLLKEKEEIIDKALPELEALSKIQPELPETTVYEGISGIKALFSKALEEKKEILAITARELIEYMQHYAPSFAKERVKRGIPLRMIIEEDAWTKQWASKFDHIIEKRKIKFLNNKFASSIYLFKDSVAMICLKTKTPTGILIQNKFYANTIRMLFESLYSK